MKRWLLRSDTAGLFVGTGLGLAFWSKLEDAGQMSIAVFETTEQAAEFTSEYLVKSSDDDIKMMPIEVANDQWATIEEIIAAGYAADLGLLLNNFTGPSQ